VAALSSQADAMAPNSASPHPVKKAAVLSFGMVA